MLKHMTRFLICLPDEPLEAFGNRTVLAEVAVDFLPAFEVLVDDGHDRASLSIALVVQVEMEDRPRRPFLGVKSRFKFLSTAKNGY